MQWDKFDFFDAELFEADGKKGENKFYKRFQKTI